ncbi:MAG TPA: MFS transporter [Mycobacteriales bacterium]|nr:MFS transporter [Mycobacteriales bacterium]
MVSRPRAALVVVCGILALTFLDTTVISVALSSIETHLHVGLTGLQWIIDAYALAFASLMLTGGTLGDRFGRKRLMLIGVSIFTAASVLGALATSADVLIASRALMGVGAAASEPGTLSIIRQLFPNQRARAKALGLWAGVSCLGLALGPVVGGVLIGIWDWRAVFWFNVAAGLAVLAAGRRWIPESSDPEMVRVDVPGQLLAVATLATVVIGVIQGELSGYFAPGIIALFVLSAICAVGFVLVEQRMRLPMLDLRYFRIARFSAALGVAFAIYFATFAIFVFTSLYLQDIAGYSGFRTAVMFVPMGATMVAGAGLAASSIARRRGRWVMTAGCAISAVGIVMTQHLITAVPSFAPLTGALAFTGLGFGMAIVPVTTAVLEIVPAARSGMAASATNTSRQLGVVFGVAVLGSLINAHLTGDLVARLRQLGIPASYQALVLGAVRTGDIPSGSGKPSPIVQRILDAAFDAFRSGLNAALITSAVLIVVAGGFATLVAARRDAGS